MRKFKVKRKTAKVEAGVLEAFRAPNSFQTHNVVGALDQIGRHVALWENLPLPLSVCAC